MDCLLLDAGLLQIEVAREASHEASSAGRQHCRSALVRLQDDSDVG